MSKTNHTNPLFDSGPLPAFGEIGPQHVAPAIDRLLEEFRQEIQTAFGQPDTANWEHVGATEERLGDPLERAWSPISHLHSVTDSAEWREAYGAAVVKLSEFQTEMNQDPDRYRAWKALSEGDEYAQLEAAQKKVVDNTLRDFRLSGIELSAEQRQRFAGIQRRLTELSTQFQQNLQDATDAWSVTLEDATDLNGLPSMQLEQARQLAAAREQEGFLINLEYPSYHAVMTYAEDRGLREQVYRAYNTRASDQGPNAGQWDNGPLIKEILELRQELAQLLGFDSYAHYSLTTKMASSPQQVVSFLEQLLALARPRAEIELAELADYAREHAGPEELAPWDVGFYAERLRKQRYDVSDEETRPYFPLPAAIDGLFSVASSLFGVSFQEKPEVPTWHPDARYFQVIDESGKDLAGFYIDLYARKSKRGGAWMADCRARYQEQLPVAFLTCNFSAPTESSPSLLSHNDLTTLFHEFGHTLHHLLTRVKHPAVGGISGVEWDAIELPSQLMENWCWQRHALDTFARHVETGEALPADLLQRMLDARHFHSGLFLLRQLEFGITDLRLHQEFDPAQEDQVATIHGQVREQTALLPVPEWNRFINGFGHLFAGGYAAGYYSYLWAEQLSADAFSRFEEEGIFNRKTGEALRDEILARGGSRDAIESFTAFRGREPEIGPLLRSYGIED
jgi:oligopeptidase A